MNNIKENDILVKDSANKAFSIVSNSSAFTNRKRKFVTNDIVLNGSDKVTNEIDKNDMFQYYDFLIDNVDMHERIFSPIIQYEVISPINNSFKSISSANSSSLSSLMDNSFLVTCISNDNTNQESHSSNSNSTLSSCISIPSPTMIKLVTSGIVDHIDKAFIELFSPKIDSNKAYINEDHMTINNKRIVVILSDDDHNNITNNVMINSPFNIKERYKNYKYCTNNSYSILTDNNNTNNNIPETSVYNSDAISISPLSIEFSKTMNL